MGGAMALVDEPLTCAKVKKYAAAKIAGDIRNNPDL